MDEEVRQPGDLAVERGHPLVVLDPLHAVGGDLGQRDVEVVVEEPSSGVLHAYVVEAAQHVVAVFLAQRFHVRGDPLDDPETVVPAHVGRHGPGFVEQLVRGFVVHVAPLVVFAREEIRPRGAVHVEAHGDLDRGERWQERSVVVVAVAEVDHGMPPVELDWPAATFRGGEQGGDLLFGGVEADE